jgi:hypothetical protein
VRQALRRLAPAVLATREELQTFGAALERQGPGQWLANAVLAVRGDDGRPIVVDSIRTDAQLAALKYALPDSLKIYLKASPDVLERRFKLRQDAEDADLQDLREVLRHEIDRPNLSLERSADLVLDTSELPVDAVVEEVLARLGS